MPQLLAYIDPGSGSLIIQVVIATHRSRSRSSSGRQIARILNRSADAPRCSRPADDPRRPMTSTARAGAAGAVERDPGSYRDPGGFVYRRDGVLYRQIGPSAIDDWTAFVASGLAERLIAAGRLIGHDDRPRSDRSRDARRSRRLATGTARFISYPYEWCFGQLKDAALLTLDRSARRWPGLDARTPPPTTSSSATRGHLRRHAVVRAHVEGSRGSPTASSASTSSRRSR